MTEGLNGAGFRPPRDRTMRLEFRDEAYQGCEVVCSLDVSMDTFLAFWGSADSDEKLRGRLRTFGDEVLREWNVVDDDGAPMAPDGESMLRLPMGFALLLIGLWLRGIQEPNAPLGARSSDGATSREPSTVPQN